LVCTLRLLLMGGIDALPLRLLLFADEDNQQEQSILICSQPGLLLPAYEAALRCLATSDTTATTAAITTGAVARAPTAAAGLLKRLFGSDAEQQQQQQQLYSLQVTCAKCGLAATSREGQDMERAAVTAFGSVVAASSKVLMHIMTQSESSFGSSSSSGSGSESSTAAPTALQQVAAPWVALLARCLHALADMMQAGVLPCQLATGPAADEPCRQAWQLQLVLHVVLSCMVTLTNHLGLAGLTPGQLQQLQEQHAAAMVQLDELWDTHAVAGPTGSVPQFSAVAQQLQSFAQAVAGRIPLNSACNNPSCVSLGQSSELVLVGGKSCVCGRCKSAR
jgi:hypothetical protein